MGACANRRRGAENWVIFSKSNYSSPTWRGIKESRLSFWFDKWLSKGTLRELISGPLNRGEKLLQLKDVYKLGSWDRNTISFAIPMTLIQDIKAILMPLGTIGIDQLSWFSAPSRGFDLKEAYKLACLEDNSSSFGTDIGNWVWKVPSLPKIRCFLWQCCHLSIPVRKVLEARGMDISHFCPLCNNARVYCPFAERL